MKEFPPEDRPNSTIVFWSFRIMVGLGFLMIFVGLWSLWLRKRGTLYSSRPFLHVALWMGPSGLVALLAGWFTTEIGRQPWVVYGLMRTADGVSNHSYAQLGFTLVAFVVVYFALFGTGLGYMMRLVRKGRKPVRVTSTHREAQARNARRRRPLSAADDGREATSASLNEGN